MEIKHVAKESTQRRKASAAQENFINRRTQSLYTVLRRRNGNRLTILS